MVKILQGGRVVHGWGLLDIKAWQCTRTDIRIEMGDNKVYSWLVCGVRCSDKYACGTECRSDPPPGTQLLKLLTPQLIYRMFTVFRAPCNRSFLYTSALAIV